MGIPIPIPTIPGNFGNGNENFTMGTIPTFPGNMGMGTNFRGNIWEFWERETNPWEWEFPRLAHLWFQRYFFGKPVN